MKADAVGFWRDETGVSPSHFAKDGKPMCGAEVSGTFYREAFGACGSYVTCQACVDKSLDEGWLVTFVVDAVTDATRKGLYPDDYFNEGGGFL